MTDQLRKAAQAEALEELQLALAVVPCECGDRRREDGNHLMHCHLFDVEHAMVKLEAALAAPTPAPEPAPDDCVCYRTSMSNCPVHGVEPAPDLPPMPPPRIAGFYLPADMRDYGQQCYDAGLAAKRAPMTREQAEKWLLAHDWNPTGSRIEVLQEFSEEASSGLTLAQAREMALGCDPGAMPVHDDWFDSGVDRAAREYNRSRDEWLAAIEAAFKEPPRET